MDDHKPVRLRESGNRRLKLKNWLFGVKWKIITGKAFFTTRVTRLVQSHGNALGQIFQCVSRV
jgi:hypothetical protein